MTSIKGVMLLPPDAASYRRHMALHACMAKANSADRVRDPRHDLARLVEDRVRAELQRHHSVTPWRVLRWEQRRPDNRYVQRFRELDGVFQHERRTTVLLEVKASASRNALKSGLSQLRAAMSTAAHAHANTVGLLAVADLGRWCDLFGQAPEEPLARHFEGMDLEMLDWPPRVPAGKTAGVCVTLVPDSTVQEWLADDLERGPMGPAMAEEEWQVASAAVIATPGV